MAFAIAIPDKYRPHDDADDKTLVGSVMNKLSRSVRPVRRLSGVPYGTVPMARELRDRLGVNISRWTAWSANGPAIDATADSGALECLALRLNIRRVVKREPRTMVCKMGCPEQRRINRLVVLINCRTIDDAARSSSTNASPAPFRKRSP